MGQHAAYLGGLQMKGTVVVFGPVGDPKGAWRLGFSYDVAPMLAARLRSGL